MDIIPVPASINEPTPSKRLLARCDELAAQRNAIDAELAQIRTILSVRHANGYRYVHFEGLRHPKINCVKAIRTVFVMEPAEALDFCTGIDQGKPRTLECRASALSSELMDILNRFFACSLVFEG